jgi:hypothetical protein
MFQTRNTTKTVAYPVYINGYGRSFENELPFADDVTRNKQRGWRKMVARAENATLPYARTVEKLQRLSSGSVSWVTLHQRYPDDPEPVKAAHSFSGICEPFAERFATHGEWLGDVAEAEALTRLYKRIREEQEGSQGMTTLGELKQTIQMIARPAESLRRMTLEIIDSIRSGKLDLSSRERTAVRRALASKKRHRALERGASGTILEWNFGVRPLVADIEATASTVVELLQPTRIPRKRLQGTSPKQVSVHSTYSDLIRYTGYAEHGMGIKITQVENTEYSVRWLAGYKGTVFGPEGPARALRALGLSQWDLGPTMWELLPWSFLWDYFTNIGDIVSAVCTYTGDVTWLSRTTRLIAREVELHDWVFDSANPLVSLDSVSSPSGLNLGTLIRERVQIVRSKPYSLEVPSLTLSVPGTDSVKWLNMAALVSQLRMGQPTRR